MTEENINQERQDKVALLKKLAKIHGELEYMKHSAAGYGYTYVKESTILGMVRPLMKKYGILLTSRMTSVRMVEVHEEFIKKGKDKAETLVQLTNSCVEVPFKFTWIDIDTGYEMEEFICLQDKAGSPQKFGGLMTYAQRYFLLKFFNIPTDTDDPDVYKSKYNKETISQKQVDRILELINGNKDRVARLCKWAGVEELNEIESKVYLEIIEYLNGGK